MINNKFLSYTSLVFLLTFTFKIVNIKPKAEEDSAFSFLYTYNNLKDTILFPKNYILAKKLYAKRRYSEALKLALSVSDTMNFEGVVSNYILIGDIFEKTNNRDKALDYLKRALKMMRIKNVFEDSFRSKYYDANLSETLFKISAIYQKQQKLDSAVYYLKELISYDFIDVDSETYKAKSFGNLSAIYFYDDDKRDLSKAREYVNKAIEINKRLKKNQSLAADYGNLASIYMKEKKMDNAKKTYLKALSYIKNNNDEDAMKYKQLLYENLAWTLYNQKDYRAYDYLENSIIISDSLRDVEVKKAVAELELKHNVDIVKKEEEVKRLQLLGEKEKYKRNVWVISIAGGALALLLLYLTSTYKLRQQNLTLELSRTELEKETQLERLKTESQTKILNAAIDGKETERKQIAETLHDNVSALLSSANMHLQASHKQFNGREIPLELKKTQKIILEASQKIRDLSHTLVSSVLLKFGLEYAIKEMANKYSNSTIQIHTDFDNIDRYNQEDEIKLYNIIQELINNILKHSKAKNAYVILEEKKNGHLKVMIKDDGKGFDMHDSAMKKGIGLNQIAARIQMMNGTFDIDTAIGKGTKVVIKVPFTRREEVTIA